MQLRCGDEVFVVIVRSVRDAYVVISQYWGDEMSECGRVTYVEIDGEIF